MKRSEMIKLIYENVNAFIVDGKLTECDAENLLIHMELAGIKPPPIQKQIEVHANSYYDCGDVYTKITNLNEWDEE